MRWRGGGWERWWRRVAVPNGGASEYEYGIAMSNRLKTRDARVPMHIGAERMRKVPECPFRSLTLSLIISNL